MVLSAALHHAERCGILARAPRVELHAWEAAAPRFLTFEEWGRLVEVASGAWRCALLLGGDAGLRVGEVLGLTWDDVDLETPAPYLRVRRSEGREGVGPPKGSERTVPLTSRLRADLARVPEAGRRGHVVRITRRGRRGVPRRSDDVLNAGLARLCDAAEIDPPITWHGLRHTFGTHLGLRGATELEIAALLGHASTETVRVYVHMSGRSLAAPIRLLEGPGVAGTGPVADVVSIESRRRDHLTGAAAAVTGSRDGTPASDATEPTPADPPDRRG